MTKEEGKESVRALKRPMWTGTIAIGLVNVPVKLHAMIFDKGISFRFLHKDDGQPLKYERVCTKDEKVVPWENVVRGYEVSKNRFVVIEKEELNAARPESNQTIRLQKFVDYLSIDPMYLDRPYLLTPDKSDDAYSLLFTALQKMGKAGVGKITIRDKEYPVLVHPYRKALVLTTLRYANEVTDPSDIEELRAIKEPGREELELAKKIVDDLSGEFDITEYRDSYQEKVKALIEKKMKGEPIVAEKPVQPEAKELMVALQETLRQLKKK
jgi:DNA end-binding protein Ku